MVFFYKTLDYGIMGSLKLLVFSFFSLGIYQRAANSDKRNEETQSPSKEEYINNSK